MNASTLKVVDDLALVYSTICPLRCDFCCHSNEEYGKQKMEPAAAITWIRQATDIPSIRRLIFTGGEPFLHYQDLLAIFAKTQDLPLSVRRIVTSAYWAESCETARARLEPLRKLGLNELSVSTDPTHQRFVPARFAENAVKAALELGIFPELVGIFWDPDSKVEDYVQVPPGVKIVRGLAIPIPGRHEGRVTPEFYRLGEDRFLGCGEQSRGDVTVYPNGDVYPCCSGGFNIRAKLGFGNLHHDPLAAVVERIHTDPFVRVIRRRGLAALYELVRFKWPELAKRLPERAPCVSGCQVCARIHSDPELLRDLAPALEYAQKVFQAVEDSGIKSCGPKRDRVHA